MTTGDAIIIDFETYPIQRRPDYPPRPVGVALDFPGMAPFYLAWGHAEGNNGTFGQAAEWLHKAYRSGRPLVFHNAKFDLEVAMQHFGLAPPIPELIHDTQFLAFLADPHARSLGLKPLAHDLLGMPPEEQDAVRNWVLNNQTLLLTKFPKLVPINKKTGQPKTSIAKSETGAWIFAAPAGIVAPYAVGDVVRTRALFDHLLPLIERNGMGPAYMRERLLLIPLMMNERQGMRTDLERLESDIDLYGKAFDFAEGRLRQLLHKSDLNFDADQDVAQALLSCGVVKEEDFPRTDPTDKHPDGQYSMSKEVLLPSLFTGPGGAYIASFLGYRNRLKTCLDTFMRPWAAQARVNNGYITTNWNQTRGDHSGGTRTGRPSTNEHNFLNISKSFDGRDDGFIQPSVFQVNLPDLPLCRQYITADEGCTFNHRDFSGQELRVFAHFEQGDLFNKYQEDPKTDPHKFVGSELMRVAQREIERTKVKVLNFQSLYGGGIPALQNKLRCTPEEARELKKFHDEALPGRRLLVEEITRVVNRGEPIRTWGGRLFYPEPAGPDGRSKLYKLINYLIQGSAAEVTKQAIIDWYYSGQARSRFLVTVYDEINISSPNEIAAEEMAFLKQVMEAPRLTVPMLSDGKRGFSWGKLEKCE